MVYRFDQSDGSGEVIYETTRWDARKTCRDDSFLGLRFPATDIPRQARELFMKNTLRFVYDVQGTDHPLYPSRVEGDMGSDEKKYTDLR
jgi:light-regulated signal transduction histidine kinase (bacteriophytochrome)